MFDKRIAIDKTNAGVYKDFLPSTYGPIGDVRIKIIKDEGSLREEIGKVELLQVMILYLILFMFLKEPRQEKC